MELLGNTIVSETYRQRLQQDLDRASVCRFLIAYISSGGIDAIGHALLARALRDPQSFGVGSLSCACGYEPLLDLQAMIAEPRLKYFLDPLVSRDRESDELVLFHSKLVLLFLESEGKAVIYIGSHNWTRRA